MVHKQTKIIENNQNSSKKNIAKNKEDNTNSDLSEMVSSGAHRKILTVPKNAI